jgi:hypothetical protein
VAVPADSLSGSVPAAMVPHVPSEPLREKAPEVYGERARESMRFAPASGFRLGPRRRSPGECFDPGRNSRIFHRN